MADKGIAVEYRNNTETIPILPTVFDIVEYRQYRNKIPVLDFLEHRKLPKNYRNCFRAAGINTNTDRPVFEDGIHYCLQVML